MNADSSETGVPQKLKGVGDVLVFLSIFVTAAGFAVNVVNGACASPSISCLHTYPGSEWFLLAAGLMLVIGGILMYYESRGRGA